MKATTIFALVGACIVFAVASPGFLYPSPACESEKCISVEASSSGCDETGRRSVNINVINTNTGGPMHYRFSYDGKFVEPQDNKWAQVLDPGGNRRHSFLTVPGMAAQTKIVIQQMGTEGNFEESYVVHPC